MRLLAKRVRETEPAADMSDTDETRKEDEDWSEEDEPAAKRRKTKSKGTSVRRRFLKKGRLEPLLNCMPIEIVGQVSAAVLHIDARMLTSFRLRRTYALLTYWRWRAHARFSGTSLCRRAQRPSGKPHATLSNSPTARPT